ncbi:unnamed protein product [Polarella glacialis]|uniref:CSD domain-containing protein n=1 Tax=Polarella glacialis TaxID=89957 RepID=A0A813HGE9_POLGL|nr:unnamed protein product [Polarella glacialis]
MASISERGVQAVEVVKVVEVVEAAEAAQDAEVVEVVQAVEVAEVVELVAAVEAAVEAAEDAVVGVAEAAEAGQCRHLALCRAAMNPAIMAQLQAMQAMGSCGGCCGGAEPEEPVEIRYYGQIRDYNESSGFGFIECAEAKARFGMDTFIHRRQMYSLGKNDKVSFVVIRNGNGQPQARNVIKKDETEKMLAKRADRESREAEKLQAKKQVTERIFTPAATDGKVMSEEEARQFQASLRKRK